MTHRDELIARFGVEGDELLVGGIGLRRLAARVGATPFFAYDRGHILRRISEVRNGLPDEVELSYAVKANPMPALVAHIAGEVDRFDVASADEMHVALNAGKAPTKVSFAGPGKTDGELVSAVAAGVTIELESLGEARRAAHAGSVAGVRPRVAVRVNPPFAVKGSGMRLGGGPQQFGVDAEAVEGLLGWIADAELDCVGFHVFAGSQNLNAEVLADAQHETLSLVADLARHAPGPVSYVNIGGGFGIPYFDNETALSLQIIGDRLDDSLRRARASAIGDASIVIELGRYLVGESGVYVTRVVDVKQSRGSTFVVVDGGLHHQLAASGNFGQVIRRNYPVVAGTRLGSDEPRMTASVVGCSCTPLDILAASIDVPRVEPGDLMVIFQAGAYGLTASPTGFLSHPLAREVVV